MDSVLTFGLSWALKFFPRLQTGHEKSRRDGKVDAREARTAWRQNPTGVCVRVRLHPFPLSPANHFAPLPPGDANPETEGGDGGYPHRLRRPHTFQVRIRCHLSPCANPTAPTRIQARTSDQCSTTRSPEPASPLTKSKDPATTADGVVVREHGATAPRPYWPP